MPASLLPHLTILSFSLAREVMRSRSEEEIETGLREKQDTDSFAEAVVNIYLVGRSVGEGHAH